MQPPPVDPVRTPISRRSLLGTSLGATASLGAVGAGFLGAGAPGAFAQSPAAGGSSGKVRKELAFRVRLNAAQENKNVPLVPHPTNGDEEAYPDKIGSFSKGLPHNAFGEVDVAAYETFVNAANGGNFDRFEIVPSGEPLLARRRKLCNPMAGVAFDLEGCDAFEFSMREAPAFDSAEEAGEIVENYWMALLRDVPFTEYSTSAVAQDACADLSAMSDFRGPKVGGAVTPETLFREELPDALVGPFVSQFFLKSQPFGAQFVDRRVYSAVAGVDYMTDPAAWLAVQNGTRPAQGIVHDPVLRFMRNGRDLSEWVHIDVLYQAYFQAALHLLTPPDPMNPHTGGGMGIARNPGNPYIAALMQDGFGTFGGPYFMTILTEVATRALKAVWHQKWYVHRRLRPEVFAGRVHHKIASNRPYPIHSDVLNSTALARVFTQHGTYLLPMAFPEGSPVHPSYGAGHATVAGACVTILKALFDTQVPFPDPIVATSDGLGLVDYTGADAGLMTVEGELNKLAHNVAYGRNIAGVHWRTDGIESLKLGEEVAIRILKDQRSTYLEPFSGFTFRRFDGSMVTV